MKSIFIEIYKASRVYWDTRFNDIHIPLSYEFARRLLLAYPQADEDVVIPAILLHDNGWKMLSEERQLNAFGPNLTDKAASRLHEVEGVRLAGEILTALDYDPVKIKEILTIIDGHDSRLEALSLNDKLVKDADKLWRFTATGLDIDHRRFGVELGAYLDYMADKIEVWFFTPTAKEMARMELARAKTLSRTR